VCLVRADSSRGRKGGTLIAEDVVDLADHERRRCSRDGYRPGHCLACGCSVLHVHEYRDRVSRADAEGAAVTIVVYQCTGCKATWRILPLFLARHLWRRWRVVEAQTVGGPPPPTQPPVPDRTLRRWASRLRSAARHLVQILATSAGSLLERVAHAVGLDGTRAQLVLAHAAASAAPAGRRLADLAALIHRLVPGVRLM
jgi:hypothetical protein